MRTVTQLFVLALALTIAAGGRSGASIAQPNVHVVSCQVVSGLFVPRPDDVALFVRFRNDGTDVLSSIVWRVKYGKTTVDVFDDGTFTPNVSIDNYALAEQGSTHINLLAAAFTLAMAAAGSPSNTSLTKSNLALPPYISTADPENCTILRATYANGDVWANPALDQTTVMLGVPTPIPTPAEAASDNPARTPIRITHCTLTAAEQPALEITFENTLASVNDRIVFRGVYGPSGVDFVDVGTFAPGSVVHHFLKHPKIEALHHQMYLSFDDPAGCAVVSVHAKDGTMWKNADIADEAGPLPTAVPSAMWQVPTKWQRHGFPSPVPSPALIVSPEPSPT